MKTRFAVVILLVAVVGCRQEATTTSPDEEMVDVVVASRTIVPNKEITIDDIAVRKFPLRLIPEEFDGDIVMGKELNALMDFQTNCDVVTGRILRWSYLHAGRSRNDPTTPPSGHRIIGIAVDRQTCPPEVSVGSWVDIMYSSESGTHWVMRKVLVKTINATGPLDPPIRNIESVGVEVRYEDAVKLADFLREHSGRVVLWLVNEAEPVPPEEGGFNPNLK